MLYLYYPTDRGKEFTYRFCRRKAEDFGKHLFDKVCESEGIEHRLTRVYTLRTNGLM
ncbi:MAG: hypothetical protein N2053_02945 [Chitinispirillaceae bacterium]|nr:hypothetical protein [Chitinispirillaceae bacterium]